jgi:hypothetical protein
MNWKDYVDQLPPEDSSAPSPLSFIPEQREGEVSIYRRQE